MICVACKQDTAIKVIYAGLPLHFCTDEECAALDSALWGLWSWLMLAVVWFIPFDGYFFGYEGSYTIALYNWFKHTGEQEE